MARGQCRQYRATTTCFLNRFLFDNSEVDASDPSVSKVVLAKDDYRTVHAAKVLGLHNGDTVRAGIVSSDDHSGLLTDDAVVRWIPEGKVKKAGPLKNGSPPGSLEIELVDMEPPETQNKLCVSLILALPRPLQLGRVLPMIAQMGVDQLILTEATKVPRDYFGSHLFRSPEKLRELLVEGLCQAGDVRLPTVRVVRNLRDFLSEDLETLFPVSDYARVIAHPQRANEQPAKRMRDVAFPSGERRIVIAIGPEGGWDEPDELDRFRSRDFQQITLGTRVLRSDVAVVSLLSLASEACIN